LPASPREARLGIPEAGFVVFSPETHVDAEGPHGLEQTINLVYFH
jgi:hypothetical protein